MTNRDRFIGYVKRGGEQFCSPQIGAGAGFDTKLAGKEWIGETTLEDTLAAVSRFDIVPLINVGCPYEEAMALKWRTARSEREENRIFTDQVFETPKGSLTRSIVETRREGGFQPKYPVTGEGDMDAMEYYIDALSETDFTGVAKLVGETVSAIRGRGALSVQWAVQPYELLCLPNTVDTVLLHSDFPERCEAMMEKIVGIDRRLFEAVAAGGADFIFLGAPAAEMLSPAFYERWIIPYSQIVTGEAHACGLMVYSHICSPIEPFLTKGFYNRMGIDLFETLSPPPVGNVASLKDALDKLDPNICTRGNVGLDLLLNGTAEDVRRRTHEVMEASHGRKHIVAASDYLFYHTPEENVRAMADAVKECIQGGIS